MIKKRKIGFQTSHEHSVARLRNRIVHGYWSIDLEILHTTATDLLPAFIDQLGGALDSLVADS